MRQNFGRVTRAIIFSALGFAICIAFQNCSGYASDYNALYDDASTTTCIGLACVQDDTMLRLTVETDTAIYVQNGTATGVCGNDDSSCISVGGFCDGGGFPSNIITYSLDGSTEVSANAVCTDGHYSSEIVLPAGYDYTAGHVLKMTIYGVLTDGSRVTNSANGNYRTVNIVTYN